MTQSEKINCIKTAPNMVEIGGVLDSVVHDYLNRYAAEQVKAPSDVNAQPEWVLSATMYFAFEIMKDKKQLWDSVPVRFHRTEIYKKVSKIFA